ncbi:cytidine deaminase [Arboricoccus pini]|uniref:Cytidine deaminase n=1 Tax=Arboricoccus pini TaxID=1963835 RepID=A0A212QTE6_9PROT|nr:purine-nucleoside phosphorylase [Arboricoccus pini]SNB62874.1 cytidine deaminase [Arboricoccus pini]
MNDLLEAACAARRQAYAPYSGFHVGAALRGESGRIYVAANTENAAYPLGTCAEAGAIAAMIAAGERRIREVAVAGSGQEPCVPCGGCRQRLAEFADAGVLVHMTGADAAILRMTLGELLPRAFALRPVTAPGISNAATLIRSRAGFQAPEIALVLGSGMGEAVEALEDAIVFSYAELDGFPAPSVAGHAGQLMLGRLCDVPVAVMRGRMHLYEGHSAKSFNDPLDTLAAIGCKTLMLTNAAGSLRPEIGPGSLVLISDHINMMGTNPMMGVRDANGSPSFLDLTDLYDPACRRRLLTLARDRGVQLTEGIYASMLGPVFETPAEIRALRLMGADLVGMSTVPEAISGRHAGMKVVALSIVTNFAAGLSASPLSHEQTLSQASRAKAALASFLKIALPEIVRATA